MDYPTRCEGMKENSADSRADLLDGYEVMGLPYTPNVVGMPSSPKNRSMRG